MAEEILGRFIPGPNLALKVHGESRVGCSLQEFCQLSLQHDFRTVTIVYENVTKLLLTTAHATCQRAVEVNNTRLRPRKTEHA
jgi:hypothetical protein